MWSHESTSQQRRFPTAILETTSPSSQSTDPAQTAAGIAWARETFDPLRPHTADSAYVNYLDADDASRIRAAYGPNYDRLVNIKRRYDPDNLFRLIQNIVP